MTLSHEDTSSLKYLHNYLNYSNLHHIFTTMKYDPLRFYSKSELAQLAFLMSHRSHRSHRFFLLSRRNKGNYLNSILSDDKFIFYLNHSENMFSRCFRENINLCSQEQSSLSKRLSSGRTFGAAKAIKLACLAES